MHDDHELVEARLARVLPERLRPAIYPATAPLDVVIWTAPGEPVPITEGIAAGGDPITPGCAWGAPWGTSWLTARGTVPAAWRGRTVEAVLDLGFDASKGGFQCEGLVHRPDGSAMKAINPQNQWVRVADRADGGEDVLLHIEAASNPDVMGQAWLPTPLGDPATAGDDPLYVLGRMDLAVFDETVWQLVQDLDLLADLMPQLPLESSRRFDIVRAVERCLDTVSLDDIGATAGAARAELTGVLGTTGAANRHEVRAVGHAHLDSAWLWPIRETVRKVTRTTSNMTDLLERDPRFVFAMSQAQQFAWLRDHRPDVFERVKQAVADGRFVPVGGMWVESDTNMPGSEAMARQFVHGQHFFLDEFGVECDGAWLPDTFGFAAGLPQIIRAAGMSWLLTQKISWSQTNTFPHHTFRWEGIDGSQVFTHFPPVDTYNCTLEPHELAHADRTFREKGAARLSLAPVGIGDGGGGTTREMLARADRLSDLDGLPRVRWQAPSEFFATAKADHSDPPVWIGELYLELHRGTLTSQARIKRGNRRCEHLLYEAELWASTAAVRRGTPYPFDRLDRLWKTVLLHQFHDILPGSSIAWVCQQAERVYAETIAELERLIEDAQAALAGAPTGRIVFNSAPHERAGVRARAAAPASSGAAVDVVEDDGVLIDNGLLRVRLDRAGLIRSVVDVATGRECVPAGAAANLLQVHPDLPNRWDAWDVDRFYRNRVTDLAAADSVRTTVGDDEVSVRVERGFGASRLIQTITVRAGERFVDFVTEVDWHEHEKFLKVAFPLDLRAEHYSAETQFGHVQRPTHRNTSWEWAKFEACQHRFLHVSEHDWGVALANDCVYGHDVNREVRPDGGTTTTLRLSLLRGPRFPDPRADQGVHRFGYRLVPGADVTDAAREGYALNLPARTRPGSGTVAPLIRVDDPAVVATAVKLADDRGGDVIVRLYECGGGRVSTRLIADFAVTGVTVCDLLERPLPDADPPRQDAMGIALTLRPFQIVTIRLART